MPTASEPPASGFRRQHPLAWTFQALAVIRSAVVPAVLFLVFSQGIAFGWLASLLALPAIAIGVARYLALRYSLQADELVVRDGILSRNERRVRYARIHNVDEVQGLLHRLLGVVAVRIETASGGEPEAVLNLAPAAVEELRRAVFARRHGEKEAEEGPTQTTPPVLEVPLPDLVRLGLIRNRGMVALAAVFGVAYQLGSDFTTMPWEWVGLRVQELAEKGAPAAESVVPELGVAGWVLGALVLVAGAYLLLSALSVTLAILRFSGFTLIEKGDDLTTRYGLVSRLRVTVPRRRIQRLRIDESLLHRLWRRISIRLDTAGGQGVSNDNPWEWGDGQESAGGRQWLAPVAPPNRLPDLVAAALPESSRQPLTTPPEPAPAAALPGWRPVERRAIQRLFNRWSLVVLFVALAAVWASRWALLLPLLLLPALWWLCSRVIRGRHYWDTDDALWWRSGWPGRRLVVVPFDKIQSVRVSQSPFDRRYEMARVTVDTAGSGVFHAVHIAYLDDAEASRLGQRLAHEAEKREFRWA